MCHTYFANASGRYIIVSNSTGAIQLQVIAVLLQMALSVSRGGINPTASISLPV